MNARIVLPTPEVCSTTGFPIWRVQPHRALRLDLVHVHHPPVLDGRDVHGERQLAPKLDKKRVRDRAQVELLERRLRQPGEPVADGEGAVVALAREPALHQVLQYAQHGGPVHAEPFRDRGRMLRALAEHLQDPDRPLDGLAHVVIPSVWRSDVASAWSSTEPSANAATR
jgi:hypothetical protein